MIIIFISPCCTVLTLVLSSGQGRWKEEGGGGEILHFVVSSLVAEHCSLSRNVRIISMSFKMH